jgi:hypothetical protein
MMETLLCLLLLDWLEEVRSMLWEVTLPSEYAIGAIELCMLTAAKCCLRTSSGLLSLEMTMMVLFYEDYEREGIEAWPG